MFMIYLGIALAVIFIFGFMIAFAYPELAARMMKGLFRITAKGAKSVIRLGATSLAHIHVPH